MQPPDLISLFAVPLNNLDIQYMITGAVAAVIYGEPRLTRDLDLVVSLVPGDAARLVAAFSGDLFYVPPAEVIEQEVRRPTGGHFNVIHHATALTADCYPMGEDRLHAWAMERRVRQDAGGVDVWVAPLGYVILRKLQWHREGGASKHLEDILDRQPLEGWIARLGLDTQWRTVGDVA